MLGKRLINSNSAATPSGSCTTDTLQILGDTSCIAYYKMSDATDESGNFDGTPTSVNFNVAGKFGNAGEFNGSSSVITGTAPSVGSSFCVSMWIKPSAYGEKNFYNLWVNSSNLFQIGFNENSNGSLKVSQKNSNTWYVFNTSATPISSLNSWYHIVVNRSSSDLKIYVNDSFIESANNYYNPSSAYGTFNIGSGKSTSNNSFFDGSIDNVRIFNKALSSSEVTTLYNEVYCVPSIVPTSNFNSVLWTGNGLTTQPITGVGFSANFTWLKCRSTTHQHGLFDTVRGANEWLHSDSTAAQTTYSGLFGILSWASDGFTVGNGSYANELNQTYVGWNWYAPTAESIGASGSRLASTIKKNVDAGFSIVEYSSTGTNNTTIGHGLSSAPELIFFKKSTNTGDWITYTSTTGANKYLFLNRSDGEGTASGLFNNINSTTFNLISGYNDYNQSGQDYIAYCFHSVDGYSKIGSYTGTGAAGNSIVTGFRPAFLMLKVSTATDNWLMYDNKRGNDIALFANLSNADTTYAGRLELNSNGFTLNTTDSGWNGSSASYIFLAIAEEVFNPSGVTRNATNPFGDASEKALYKFEDNATDAEGNYNGTWSGTEAYATGYIDKAAVFNGTTSRIGLGTNTFNSLTSFSFSCWVNLNNAPTGYEYLFDGWDYQNSSKGLAVRISPSGNIQANTGFSNSVTTITSSGTITHSVWTHIVATFSQSHTTISINGNIESPQSNGGFNFFTGTTYNLGAFIYTSSIYEYFLDGKLDQVRIFNRALDSGEVTQLYNE